MMHVRRTRVERVLQILSEAVLGNYAIRLLALDDAPDDAFLELEVATNMLLDELQQTRERNTQQHQELQRQTEQLRTQQAELVAALSTPIIVVAKGVLALPVIGAVAHDRAQLMTEEVLNRVVAERARYVILDMTGAGEIAAETAQSLLRMAQAVRLLGARCLITGLSPTMTRTLVGLDFDSSQVVTLPQLADALRLVLGEADKTPVKASRDALGIWRRHAD